MVALKMPFDATSLPMLSLKIIRGSYNPVPSSFSKDIKNLIACMLQVDANKRPSITELLKLPVIKNRIKGFLDENEYNSEFSHTILHKHVIIIIIIILECIKTWSICKSQSYNTRNASDRKSGSQLYPCQSS